MPSLAIRLRSSLAVLAVVMTGGLPGHAASDGVVKRSFVIPATDGYGIGDCLAKGGACGRIVADSWCEANGLGKSISFGSAEDMTGAIATPDQTAPAVASGSFVINCGD